MELKEYKLSISGEELLSAINEYVAVDSLTGCTDLQIFSFEKGKYVDEWIVHCKEKAR